VRRLGLDRERIFTAYLHFGGIRTVLRLVVCLIVGPKAVSRT
jgi:hypothetical protein